VSWDAPEGYVCGPLSEELRWFPELCNMVLGPDDGHDDVRYLEGLAALCCGRMPS
jgi:hypothetical protein